MASLRFLLFTCMLVAAAYAGVTVQEQEQAKSQEPVLNNDGNIQRGKKDVLLSTVTYPVTYPADHLLRSISPVSLVPPVSPINHILPYYRSLFPYYPYYPYNYPYIYRK